MSRHPSQPSSLMTRPFTPEKPARRTGKLIGTDANRNGLKSFAVSADVRSNRYKSVPKTNKKERQDRRQGCQRYEDRDNSRPLVGQNRASLEITASRAGNNIGGRAGIHPRRKQAADVVTACADSSAQVLCCEWKEPASWRYGSSSNPPVTPFASPISNRYNLELNPQVSCSKQRTATLSNRYKFRCSEDRNPEAGWSEGSAVGLPDPCDGYGSRRIPGELLRLFRRLPRLIWSDSSGWLHAA